MSVQGTSAPCVGAPTSWNVVGIVNNPTTCVYTINRIGQQFTVTIVKATGVATVATAAPGTFCVPASGSATLVCVGNKWTGVIAVGLTNGGGPAASGTVTFS